MDSEFTSSDPRPRSRLDEWQPWFAPLALVLVSTLLELGGDPVRMALRYDRAAIGAGQWWRLLTGNFVHLGAWHLLLNGLSLALLVMLCPDRLPLREWLRRVVLLSLGMSAGLYLCVPALPTYVGLSGMVYGLFTLGLGRQAVNGDRIALMCLLFLAGRIVWELTIGAPASEEALIGGTVVAGSHLSGAVSALIYGGIFGVFRRSDPSAPGRGFAEDARKGP